MSAVATIGQIERSLLQVRSLHKNFGGVKAVSDISFDVPAGSIFSVIGPNGAGKSTLLNLISGVYQPDSGSLSFNGTALSAMPAHRRVRLGIARTFQKIRLFKQLSVLENVIAGFHVHHHIGMAIRDAWRRFCGRSTTVSRTGRAAFAFRWYVGTPRCACRIAVIW